LDRHIELVAAGRTDSAAPWPHTLSTAWLPHLHIDARARLLTAMARYLLVRPRAHTPRAVVSFIALGFSRPIDDPARRSRAAAALCLKALLRGGTESRGITDANGVPHLFDTMRAKLEAAVRLEDIPYATNDFRELAALIDEWFRTIYNYNESDT